MVLVLLLAALLWGSCGLGDGFFFKPNAVEYAALPRGAEELTFVAPGGPLLHGWWLPATAPVRGTVVFCHGNARNLTWHAQYVQWFTRYGFQVLLFDYRGYGRSDGSPSRAGACLLYTSPSPRDPE